ncbi:hypothetical protein PS3A_29410 [Pseudomonas sp. 3A(2025)]
MGIMLLALILLMLRAAGLYPLVMRDEYTYSMMTRLMTFQDASIPGYLYIAIYQATSLCGSASLFCSKFFNVLFFVAAAPFIHAVARRFCGPGIALLIVTISLLGPINSYTTYYMPEPLFFLTFWISVWYFLRLKASALASQWLVFGVLMGCSALVKPHALLVIPGFCLCILFFAYKDTGRWLASGLKSAALFVFAMLATKFFVSFVLAGKAGLTLFGGFYNETLQSSTGTLQRLLDIFKVLPGIVEGHVLANTLMFGVALAVILFGSIKAVVGTRLQDEERIAFFTLALLLNLIAVVSLFSASVVGVGVYETASRLHMRYYDFMLPLLFIAAGAQINREHGVHLKNWRLVITVLVLGVLCYAALTRMQPYTPSHIDSPELRGYMMNRIVFMGLAGLSALVVLLWYTSARIGSLLFICFYLPLSVGVSAVYNNALVRERLVPDAFDRAGLFAKSYLSDADLSRLAVVGESEGDTWRPLLYLDNLQATRDRSYVPGLRYQASQTPENITWILGIGDIDFAEGEFDVMYLNGFSLARKISGLYLLQLDFSKALSLGPSTRITGLSHPEPVGTWSLGDRVEIKFAEPLPAVFQLSLSATGFGPNENKPFNVEVEGKHYPLMADGTLQTLRIATSGQARKLSLLISAPTSPQALGLSVDGRLLGIRLKQLEIAPAN